MAYVDAFIHDLQNGLPTEVENAVWNFLEDKDKRIAIARALLRNPQILMLMRRLQA